MHRTLTVNGIRKEWLYLLRGRQESPYAPINHTLIHIPGMAGAHVASTDTDVLYVSQPVGFKVESEEHEQALLDEIKEWLITKEDVEIQFDNVPGKTYIGRITASMNDYSRQGKLRSGTLTFLCKPYKYGPETLFQFTDDIVTIENKGTAEATPVFGLEVLAPITFALIQNQDSEYMMIGRPVTANDTVVDPTTHIMTDTGDSIVGWTAGGNPPDGIATGEIRSIDGKLRAFNYGEGPGWHGPVIKKSLPQVLQDFNIQVWIEFNEALADNTGRIQISLLDAGNNTVGMLSFFDVYPQWFDKVGRAEVGDKILVSDRDSNWSNTFLGRLTMQRKGQEIIAKIQQFRNGKYIDTIEGKFTDFLNEHQAPIAQIQLHFGAFGTHTRPFMAVDKIQVLRLNDTTNKVPYIAQSGDIITFDHEDENILLNGESIISNKDFGAEYFTLKPGDNQLIVLPENSFNASVKYRERFK